MENTKLCVGDIIIVVSAWNVYLDDDKTKLTIRQRARVGYLF